MLIRKDVRTKIRNDYFEWLFRITCENKFAKDISYLVDENFKVDIDSFYDACNNEINDRR